MTCVMMASGSKSEGESRGGEKATAAGEVIRRWQGSGSGESASARKVVQRGRRDKETS